MGWNGWIGLKQLRTGFVNVAMNHQGSLRSGNFLTS